MKFAFTRKELKDFINIGDDRTIASYIKRGVLPPFDENGEVLIKDVCKAIGLDGLPSESFMTPSEARKYLGIKMTDLGGYVKNSKIPHYNLINGKGARALFLKSELDEYLKFKIEKSGSYNLSAKAMIKKIIFALNINSEQMINNGLSANDIIDGLISEKSFSELSKRKSIHINTFKNRFIKTCTEIAEKIDLVQKEHRTALSLWNEIANLKSENIRLSAEVKQLTNVIKVENIIYNITSVADVDKVSIRVKNFLAHQKIDSVEMLSTYSFAHINKFRNLGEKSILEMTNLLANNGLTWAK